MEAEEKSKSKLRESITELLTEQHYTPKDIKILIDYYILGATRITLLNDVVPEEKIG